MRNGTPGGNYSLVNETAVALDSDEWIIILGLVCFGELKSLFLAKLPIMNWQFMNWASQK